VDAGDSPTYTPEGDRPSRLEGHLVICGDWHQCLVVQELMACCARTYGFEDFGIRKALKEALANAFKHGNGGLRQKRIRVDYEMDDTEFRVAITDEGSGFKHQALAPVNACPSSLPAGRGVGLMRSYMTAVRFNGPGNCVELSKRKNGSK
jgi:hypothetical protein